jgi:tetratricopeptide (TPR) repeat protein
MRTFSLTSSPLAIAMLSLLFAIQADLTSPAFSAEALAEPSLIASTDDRVRATVEELGYSDKVGQDALQMARDWGLADMRELIVRTKRDYQDKSKSLRQLVQVQQRVVEDFSRKIQNEIRYEESHFDLARIIQNKKASCFGYSQLFYIVGRTLELSIQVIEVRGLGNHSLAFNETHSACLVTLEDGTAEIVDNSNYVSKPFVFDNLFIMDGHYWELRDKAHPLVRQERIQVWDTNGVKAGILSAKGNECVDAKRFEEAITHYNEAAALNPYSDVVFHNRGNAYYTQQKYSDAIPDFEKAIALNPKDAMNHSSRGDAYSAIGKNEEAMVDYNNAVKLGPQNPYAFTGTAE